MSGVECIEINRGKQRKYNRQTKKKLLEEITSWHFSTETITESIRMPTALYALFVLIVLTTICNDYRMKHGGAEANLTIVTRYKRVL